MIYLFLHLVLMLGPGAARLSPSLGSLPNTDVSSIKEGVQLEMNPSA